MRTCQSARLLASLSERKRLGEPARTYCRWGTGGHIIPALAVARELVARYSAEMLFVGTERGIESRLVPDAGFRFHLIEVGPLKNVSLVTRLRTLLDLPRSVIACRRIIRDFKPNVVFGVGGYASGPAMAAALNSRFQPWPSSQTPCPDSPIDWLASACKLPQSTSVRRQMVSQCRSHRNPGPARNFLPWRKPAGTRLIC